MSSKSGSGTGSGKGPNIQGIAGELFKRAVTLGAGAYVSAEDRVTKTLNTVQAPIHISKNVMSELLDSFLKSYSLQVTAKIDFVKRDDKSDSKKSDKQTAETAEKSEGEKL